MGTVTLTIGPKTYKVACADGEEAHVTALGAMIAEKYAQLGKARTSLEAQNLLFTALLLADELAEARANASAHETAPAHAPGEDERAELKAQIARLEAELATARAAAAAPAPPQSELFGSPDALDLLAERLEALAARAEASATALESAAAGT
jgi:cell division protein ZapA